MKLYGSNVAESRVKKWYGQQNLVDGESIPWTM